MNWEEAFECVKADRCRTCELLAMASFTVGTCRKPELQATLMARRPPAIVMCRTLDACGMRLPAEYAALIPADADSTGAGVPEIH